MPGFATHYLFGIDSLKRMEKNKLRDIINKNRRVYQLGLQGPDIFFYYLPSYLMYEENPGSLVHHSNASLYFRNCIKNIDKERNTKKKEIAIAYLCGILGHYTLDFTTHPYIYYMTDFHEKTSEYYGRHIAFETKINEYLLYKKRHLMASQFYNDSTVRITKNEAEVVAKILSATYKDTFEGYNMSKKNVLSALNYFQKSIRLLRGPGGKKRKLIGFFEKLILGNTYFSNIIDLDEHVEGELYMNFSHKMWKNPWDNSITSNKSFFELTKDAKKIYKETLDAVNDYFTLDDNKKKNYKKLIQLIGNKSYHSGLDCGIPT
ncbi:Zinc dependent phospholipase C [Acetitomaculum ruminis DSM 5522]|uniref:Zinc dependent phospholipase C n=1 Tax=Acetitomaculum ruminis DSM 5522 TaxID=1120918 RepID=A0A1I0W929_9FIRM|nr:zinc dependent phospholipase C family protein [Acetitomaculum ruminis]SFA84760.1 Zinc dependent phospholipase C [Acetitomaculum ruminis DSM 5522]